MKMEDDAHQPDELSSQLRVMKTYLKARYRLSDLLGAQRNDGLTSNLKRSIENGSPDKGDVEEVNDRILRQYFMQREGRFYLNKDGIVPYMGREEDKILYKYKSCRNSIKQNFYSGHMIKWATRGLIKYTRGS